MMGDNHQNSGNTPENTVMICLEMERLVNLESDRSGNPKVNGYRTGKKILEKPCKCPMMCQWTCEGQGLKVCRRILIQEVQLLIFKGGNSTSLLTTLEVYHLRNIVMVSTILTKHHLVVIPEDLLTLMIPEVPVIQGDLLILEDLLLPMIQGDLLLLMIQWDLLPPMIQGDLPMI